MKFNLFEKIVISLAVLILLFVLFTVISESRKVTNEQICLNAHLRPVYIYNPSINDYEVPLCNVWHTLKFYSIDDGKLVEVKWSN